MIARKLTHYRLKVIYWFRRTFFDVAVNQIILAMQQEHARTREKLTAYIESVTKRETSRLLAEIATVRVEIELLRAALPIAEQMNDFAAKVESVDERLNHLTAHLCGTSMAEKIKTSRGPREFSYEDRQ